MSKISIGIGNEKINPVDEDKLGDLDLLQTTNKNNLVEAINEISNNTGGAVDLADIENKITELQTKDNALQSKDIELNDKIDNTKTTLTNLITANTSTLRKDLVSYTVYNTKIVEIDKNFNSVGEAKKDKENALDAEPYSTGNKIENREIIKIIWRNIHKYGSESQDAEVENYKYKIQDVLNNAYTSDSLLDATVYGFSYVEDDGTVIFLQPKLAYRDGQCAVGIMKVRANGSIIVETKSLTEVDTNYIKAIEVLYLQ